jgi:hypothetical protein
MSGTEIQDKLPVPRGLDTSSLRRGHRQAIYGELSTKGKTTVVNIGIIIIIQFTANQSFQFLHPFTSLLSSFPQLGCHSFLLLH